ncbi:chromodomain-helicase-DNA-binding protein 1-like isoform X2 [Tubulanus polymorphus]|uniref:chromodomain-helicase-DNA-binding protein 1-like isoform X2 n=1 Tax=Tubulanus polymorphus TaxID=672921 RepID=UPI003DA5BF2C
MDRIKTKLIELKDEYEKVNEVTENGLSISGLTKLFVSTDITLRPYQLDGVNWLVQRYTQSHGCILGDEMGLGKTCQTISFMVHVNDKIKTPHLVLCPLSVLSNWQMELKKFAPSLAVISYVGDKDTRSNIQTDIRSQKNRTQYHFDVLLTTYEVCLKDEDFLCSIPWHLLVVDEAHRLKNSESKLHRSLKEFEVENRLLLTGTPVQNNLSELYSLLSFVAPRIFYRKYIDEFIETFTDAEEKEMKELHELLQPFLLRRVKSQVLKDLPSKCEVVLYHGLSDLQKKYYKAILTKDIDAFEKNEMGVSKTRLMNILMQLRKCVAHPYLFDGVEPEPFELGEHLVTASSKLVVIDQLLMYLKKLGHKVLLFSQMTRMLDIIQDYLGYRGYSYERLDGSVRGEERFLAIQNFNKEESTFVFLLSTKAGGVGLNLTSADTVIFVDSDFNPQNDLQAAARAHRIGQQRPVKIIRLIGRSTVEEVVLRRAEAKLKLTNSVIEGGQFSLIKNKEDLIADNNMKLQDILKFGVDKLFNGEEDMDVDVDFDKILGATVDKRWLNKAVAVEEAQSLTDPVVDEEVAENATDMYVFDGKDFKTEPSVADQEAMDKMIALQQSLQEQSLSENRSRRSKNMKFLQLPDQLPARKPRKKLTPEELEERRKKRKEAAERKAQEEEEEEVRRAQEQKKKIEDLWAKNDYTSCNMTLDSEGGSESSSDDDEEEENDGNSNGDEDEKITQISYISGDVTHPQNTKNKNAIIVHCVDDSGSWGYGGLFTALSTRSMHPQEQYTIAGKMKDLALGDCHIMEIDDIESRSDGKDWCALIVAQHRDRKNRLSGIKLSALSQGLQRIYKAAKGKKDTIIRGSIQ